MYLGALSMLLVSLADTVAVYMLHRLTAVSPHTLLSLPSQSGWQPVLTWRIALRSVAAADCSSPRIPS